MVFTRSQAKLKADNVEEPQVIGVSSRDAETIFMDRIIAPNGGIFFEDNFTRSHEC